MDLDAKLDELKEGGFFTDATPREKFLALVLCKRDLESQRDELDDKLLEVNSALTELVADGVID